MKIKILNLFHNYLNLYGEQANIKAITYYLEKQDIEYEVINHKFNQEIDYKDIDLVVCGQGIEENLDKAIAQIDKDSLCKYLEKGGFIFLSGNASKILSKQGLNLCDYEVIEEKDRIVFEGLYNSSITNHECINFINSFVRIKENDNWVFKLNRTNTPDITYTVDGYHKDNVYVTALIGPVLIRNPWLNEEILKALIINKDKDFKFKELDYSLEENALEEFKNLYYSSKK